MRSDRQTVTGEEGNHVTVFEGNVDVRVGIYRLQADKVTDYEAQSRVVAEGKLDTLTALACQRVGHRLPAEFEEVFLALT